MVCTEGTGCVKMLRSKFQVCYTRGVQLDELRVPQFTGQLKHEPCQYLSQTYGSNTAHCLRECSQRDLLATQGCRLRLKCDGTRAETRFRLSAKRTGPFKSSVASVQSTTGSRGVRISGSNAGYTMFRGSVKRTGYPLHSPVSPSLPLPCVTVCHHISTGDY